MLLMMVFFTLLMVLAATAAAPRILTEGKREKEVEMIWRGKQYVRAIKLYYRKTGKFPTTLDDLTKPKLGSLRFLRQAYKDPMNKEDGSWRLLYVGPAGQIIGSLKPQPAGVQMPGGGAFGTPVSSLNGGPNGQSPNGLPNAANPGQSAGQGSNPAQSGAQGTDASEGNPSPQPLSGDIIGGNIIGVASKVNERSVKVYEKATRYRMFEFYWDPAKDQAAAVQQGMQPGAVPGGNMNGLAPGTPVPGAPQPNPQQTPQPQNPPENQ